MPWQQSFNVGCVTHPPKTQDCNSCRNKYYNRANDPCKSCAMNPRVRTVSSNRSCDTTLEFPKTVWDEEPEKKKRKLPNIRLPKWAYVIIGVALTILILK